MGPPAASALTAKQSRRRPSTESWPDTLDREAVWPALGAFFEVVGDVEDYEVIIASDFENQVKARLESG
jgi:hypothetical protein